MKLPKIVNNSLVGVIDNGCSIEGKITFAGSLRLNGSFKGEIEGKGTLLIGRQGHANAIVKVDEVIIEGRMHGKVNAETRVEIHKGGELQADISTNCLIIEEGGIFKGSSMMEVADKIELNPEEQRKKAKIAQG